MGNDQDDLIMAPSTTVFYRLKAEQFIDMIHANAASAETKTDAQGEVERIFSDAHRFEDGQNNNFTIRDQTEITETASVMAQTMTLLLASIAGVSLVVGGIGIMNIMLVSETERTRESSIRVFIGARSRDVFAQFLLEADVLSLATGVVGILLAVPVSFALDELTSLTTSISMEIVAVAFVFSAAVGVFFGYYPARKAASLNPIDAVRYE